MAPSLQASWDYRWVRLTPGRMYWVTTDPSYTQDTLRTMALPDGVEQQVYGPTGVRGAAAWSGQLVFTEAFGASGFRSWRVEGAGAPAVIPTIDGSSAIRAWSDPLVGVVATSGVSVVNRLTGQSSAITTRLGSVTAVVVSGTHVGGHDRDPWGNRAAVFLDALDGSTHWRFDLDTNDFVTPSLDGRRLVWTHRDAVWLYEAP